MACLEEKVISVCVLLGDEKPGYDLQVSPVWRGSYASVVVSIGTKHRVQSLLERWPSMIRMNVGLIWGSGPMSSFFTTRGPGCEQLHRGLFAVESAL